MNDMTPQELIEAYKKIADQEEKKKAKAEALKKLPMSVYWLKMTDKQKAIVKFGMIPVEIAEQVKNDLPHLEGRLMAVGLMDCATLDGGMVC